MMFCLVRPVQTEHLEFDSEPHTQAFLGNARCQTGLSFLYSTMPQYKIPFVGSKRSPQTRYTVTRSYVETSMFSSGTSLTSSKLEASVLTPIYLFMGA